MNKYNLRKNYIAFFTKQKNIIRGKLAFKTKELHWLETHHPVIVLISIHSLFHEEVNGDLKMNALITTVKNHVKGPVTVLFCDIAHIHTSSLNYGENMELTLQKGLADAHLLSMRYLPYCKDCNIVYWHSYISQDPDFHSLRNLVKNSYKENPHFQTLIDQDAESTYTNERMKIYPDRELFIKKAKEDLFDQCAGLLILVNKGYRFQFYPGTPYSSIEYVNKFFTSESKKLSWIDVFLTIEKKTVILN